MSHPHQGSAEQLPPPSQVASVVVDVGGDVGAAMVVVPDELAGEEIEVRPEPGVWEGRHVAVRPRHLPGGVVQAALFDQLDAGRYCLRVRFGPPGATEVTFDVAGARVSEVAWPGAPVPL